MTWPGVSQVSQRAGMIAGVERLRTVSVGRAVAAFLIAGLVVLSAIGVVAGAGAAQDRQRRSHP